MGKKRRMLTTKKFNAKHSAHPRMKMATTSIAETTATDDVPPAKNTAIDVTPTVEIPEAVVTAPTLTQEASEAVTTAPTIKKTTKTATPRKKTATKSTTKRKRTTKKKTTTATA